ncbi:WD40-repeat-containing domain protein [Pavlovales sp. CCMP2436]|nr:WD40-repeat-containing domain protein [Pavlovales sp. CCMP2436]
MVKAYLRYVQQDAAFGVIASPNCNAAVHPDGTVFTGALESVLRWSVRKGSLVQRYHAPPPSGPAAEATAEVVRVELDPAGGTLAVGHFDGRVRLWDVASGVERVTLFGHKRAVTSLRFDASGLQLASGGADTDIVIWDVTSECGLFRLLGHRDAVTDLAFLPGARHLVSCSKDGLLKMWDLKRQHCVHTAVGHSSEVWALDASPDGTRIVSAGADDHVRLWRVAVDEEAAGASGSTELVPAGTLRRRGKARAVSVRYDASGRFLAIASLDRAVDVYSARSAAESKRAAKRLAKRADERTARKARKADSKRFIDEAAPEPDADGDEDGSDEEAAAKPDAELASLEFAPHLFIRASSKLASAAFAPRPSGAAAAALGASAAAAMAGRGNGGAPAVAGLLVLALRSNALAAYALGNERAGADADGADGDADGGGAAPVAELAVGAHRSEVRALCMSGDGRLVATVSDGQACVWAAESGQCLHSLPCGYGLCCALLAAASHLLVGTKAGELKLYNLGAATLVQNIEAHEGKSVWAVSVQPGGLGVLSAGADKTVRTWTLEALRLADGTGTAGRVSALRLSAERVLRLTDDALAAVPSPDGKYVCVALLDGTVKVLFADSFKFYLSLYGHKLPALAVDVASDSAIVATGSADKSVKLWGLDFGDCRRSLSGHTEAVTAVRFVRDTHYLFSASKGRRAVRVWVRTEEQLFLDEEREAELDKVFELGLEGGLRDEEGGMLAERALLGAQAGGDGLGGEDGNGASVQSGAAARRSLESMRGSERLLEALSTLKQEEERRGELAQAVKAWHKAGAGKSGSKCPVLVPNMLLLGKGMDDYLLHALRLVKAADLEQALLLLPFAGVVELLRRIAPLPAAPASAELLAKVTLFAARVHHRQLSATPALAPLVAALHAKLDAQLRQERSVVGYNLAVLRHLKDEAEAAGDGRLFEEAIAAREVVKKAAKEPGGGKGGVKNKSAQKAKGEKQGMAAKERE